MPPSLSSKDPSTNSKNSIRVKKRHTLKHQLIILLKTGEIIDVDSSEGKKHDFELLKESALDKIIDETIEIQADSGYQGLEALHPNCVLPIKKSKNTQLSDNQKEHNRNLSKSRVKIEPIIGRLKVFKLLVHPYRNRKIKHRFRLKIIAAIHNLQYRK